MSQFDNNKNNNPAKDDKVITLCIKTAQGDWQHDFLKTTKVEDVIKAIIAHFHFAVNGKYELRLESDPAAALQPNRPLESYHIKDNDCVILTDLGAGV